MNFKIVHETNYSFSSEVFLEPHYLRFKPRVSGNISLQSFQLDVLPTPAGRRELLDSENNLCEFAWFDGLTNQLNFKAESLVSIKKFNPFDFFVYPDSCNNLPFTYPTELSDYLTPYLEQQKLDDDLLEYATLVKNNCNSRTLDFIIQLTQKINQDFKIESRETGAPLGPNETFISKIGSCRDLTWMQIHIFRYLGIASRYVSGYYYVDAETPAAELHAWTEVYLPGAGWMGFDPTGGVTVAGFHIPVCTSATPENTLPVIGTIRGSSSSTLSTKLTIDLID